MLELYMKIQRFFEGDSYSNWSLNKKEHEVKIACCFANTAFKLDLQDAWQPPNTGTNYGGTR
jgi:hypothetical protein